MKSSHGQKASFDLLADSVYYGYSFDELLKRIRVYAVMPPKRVSVIARLKNSRHSRYVVDGILFSVITPSNNSCVYADFRARFNVPDNVEIMTDNGADAFARQGMITTPLKPKKLLDLYQLVKPDIAVAVDYITENHVRTNPLLAESLYERHIELMREQARIYFNGGYSYELVMPIHSLMTYESVKRVFEEAYSLGFTSIGLPLMPLRDRDNYGMVMGIYKSVAEDLGVRWRRIHFLGQHIFFHET
ncbi:MAG: hypothetical protein QXY20_07170 [Thermofilum sp.]|uniref:hypothetical protein n=1 Tax=Thermofilum sp. TaxID=1961369 RepID=UPI003164E7D4